MQYRRCVVGDSGLGRQRRLRPRRHAGRHRVGIQGTLRQQWQRLGQAEAVGVDGVQQLAQTKQARDV